MYVLKTIKANVIKKKLNENESINIIIMSMSITCLRKKKRLYHYHDNNNVLPVKKMCKPSNRILTTSEYQTKPHEVTNLSSVNQARQIWKFPDH